MAKGVSNTVTRNALADLLGVHPMTITKWERDGMPVAARGGRGRASRYVVSEVFHWRVDSAGASSETLNLQNERAALARAQRVKTELHNRLAAGEVLERDAVRAELVDAATRTKARIRAVPDAVADQLAGQSPAAIRALLLAKLDDALRELARLADVAPEATEPDEDGDDDDGVMLSLEAHP